LLHDCVLTMELIERTDSQYFEVTSDKPYNRHQYKITFDGGRSIVLNDYEELRRVWFEYVRTRKDVKVEVIDVKKGFK